MAAVLGALTGGAEGAPLPIMLRERVFSRENIADCAEAALQLDGEEANPLDAKFARQMASKMLTVAAKLTQNASRTTDCAN